MDISIVCSSPSHPVYPRLEAWAEANSPEHDIRLVHKVAELTKGDVLFLISCSEIVPPAVRSKFFRALVVHAAPLPRGKGWSPHIWQVLDGATVIPVLLIEADDPVDSGRILAEEAIRLEGHELFDEINEKLFVATLTLMDFAVAHHGDIQPRPQDSSVASTYYRKRTPADSRLDPARSLEEQFDLLRVADPARFPAFFELRGHRYRIRITKDDE